MMNSATWATSILALLALAQSAHALKCYDSSMNATECDAGLFGKGICTKTWAPVYDGVIRGCAPDPFPGTKINMIPVRKPRTYLLCYISLRFFL